MTESEIKLDDSVESPVKPNLFWALRGLWLFTVRSQFRLQRLPRNALAVFAVPIFAWLTVDTGDQFSYQGWLVNFYFLLIIPLFCLEACGSMVRDEVQADTLCFILTRPIKRAQFFLMKYMCNMGVIQIIFILQVGLIFLVGLVLEIPDMELLYYRFLGIQIISIFAIGALCSLLGVITKQYLVLGIIYGVIIEIGVGQIPTNINNLSILRQSRVLLANIESIASQYNWSAEYSERSIIILGSVTVLFVVIAAVIFTYREFQFKDPDGL